MYRSSKWSTMYIRRVAALRGSRTQSNIIVVPFKKGTNHRNGLKASYTRNMDY